MKIRTYFWHDRVISKREFELRKLLRRKPYHHFLVGNAGDLMIQQASYELFSHFGISYRVISGAELRSGVLAGHVDEIVFSGGVNMGTLWQGQYQQRQRAKEFGLPITLFPQSFTNSAEDTSMYHGVFVREKASLETYPESLGSGGTTIDSFQSALRANRRRSSHTRSTE